MFWFIVIQGQGLTVWNLEIIYKQEMHHGTCFTSVLQRHGLDHNHSLKSPGEVTVIDVCVLVVSCYKRKCLHVRFMK